MVRMLRDQPCSTVAAAYLSRASLSLSLVRSTMLCPHGICPTACWTIAFSGQALDDLTAPPLLGLVVEDVPADLPVKPEQLGVDRQRGTLLGGVDAPLDVGQPTAASPLGPDVAAATRCPPLRGAPSDEAEHRSCS
jgi:hypothetical protein